MLSKREKDRLKWSLLFIYGLSNTFEQWCRVLLPFCQWQLRPRPSMFDTLLLNSIGNASVVLGSFLIAQMIDSIGGKKTAIIATIVVSLYQAIVPQISDYYIFGVLQMLLVFNHMPTIVEALIAQLIGEDGDEKERSRLMMRLTIPVSVAFAAGPYCAVQVLYIFSPTLKNSQTLCGVAHFFTVLPLIIFLLPEQNYTTNSKLQFPTIHAYFELLRDSKFLWTLLFIVVVTGPYAAYDQVLRTQLATQMLTDPGEMAKLALILGSVTLIVNIFILPRLQNIYGPQILLLGSMGLLFFSYLFLATTTEYAYLLIGLPFQIVGVCIASGLLTAQLMGEVPRTHMGKAAALNRIAQLAATTMTPLLTGYYVDGAETKILCYTSAAITALGIPLVFYKGGFMRQHFSNLPIRTHSD
jgi:MFS family permease